MTQTEATTATPTPTSTSLSGAFALFSLSLLGLLALSQNFLLPRFTRIPVAGSLLTIDELQQKEDALSAAVEQAEVDRRELMLPSRDAAFQDLQEMKLASFSPLDLQRRLREVAATAGGDQPNAVAIQGFTYSSSGSLLRLTGDVSGVGARSMTVLAGFVDLLRAEPFVEQFEAPAFVREESPAGFHSPFAITIHLRSASL